MVCDTIFFGGRPNGLSSLHITKRRRPVGGDTRPEDVGVLTSFVAASAVSAVVCVAILRSSGWHLHFTADHPDGGPQKFHDEPTPRIGGLAILCGLLAAAVLVKPDVATPGACALLLFCLLPAFLGGFAEDITRKVPPISRLLATMVTAGFAWALLDVRLLRSDVAWLDLAFTYTPFAYAGLLLAVAGIAHAMNIIDGYNGLSGGVGTIILLALGAVAAGQGDTLVACLCFATAGALCGFLLFNYPSGKIFLGDGGAYLQGCIIAIAAAILVQRNPGVSPWFPFALVLYPIWETLFSILRRLTIHHSGIGQPDARHLHSLVYRRLAHRWIRRRDAVGTLQQNAVTTLPFWVMTAVMAALAVKWSGSTGALQLISVLFICAYLAAYLHLTRVRRPMSHVVASYLRRRAERRRSFKGDSFKGDAHH